MYRGRIVGTVSPQTSREEIGLLMAGITADDAAVGAAPPEGPEQTERGGETGQPEQGSTARPGADAADGPAAGGQATDVRARGGGMGGVGPVGGAGEAAGGANADGGRMGAGGVTGTGAAGAGAAGGSAADGGAAGEGPGRGGAEGRGAEGSGRESGERADGDEAQGPQGTQGPEEGRA